MILYKIPLTTEEEIGKRLDSIHYKGGCDNRTIGRNLLSINRYCYQDIFLKLDDEGHFLNWQYDIYDMPFKTIPLDEIYLGEIK